MRVEIRSVAGKGNFEKERLILRVLADTDIGEYVLLQSDFDEDSVTTDIYNSYWFPYKEVKAGDLIVLYTKSGRDNEKELQNGKRSLFFYWDLTSSIWEHDNRAPVLLHAPNWISKDPDEL